ncbi:MAG: hypothetical protein AABW59_03420 [archaeon]
MPLRHHVAPKGIKRILMSKEDLMFRESRSSIWSEGAISNEVFLKRLHDLRKQTSTQGEKYLPALERTFAEVAPLLPNELVLRLMKEKHCENISQLSLELYKNTIFLSSPVFNEVKIMGGVDPAAGAFYYGGVSVVRVGIKPLQRMVFYPLLHEWIHNFDAAGGRKRDTSSAEALAYGIDLFVGRSLSGISIKKRSIRVGDTPHDKEYARGFHTGKIIAILASELQGKRGKFYVEKFFHTLFDQPKVDIATATEIKNILMK